MSGTRRFDNKIAMKSNNQIQTVKIFQARRRHHCDVEQIIGDADFE